MSLSNEVIITRLFIFALAGFLGLEVIRRVPKLLHTPLMALTKPPNKPPATGDSNNTGHSVVAILRDLRRLNARWAA
mgnify:CR=1 FL=1